MKAPVCKILSLWIFFNLAWVQPVTGQTILTGTSNGMAFEVEQVIDGLGVPWGMAFLNTNEILFTERGGKAGILMLDRARVSWLKGVPKVLAEGQGGLLDVAVPPGYEPSGWIYFTYSKNINGQGVTTLARAHRQNDQLTNWQDLLVTRSATNTSRHFGSRITFDGKGHLFFTIGDRGKRPNAQDLSNHAGSVLRLNLDGSVPPGNPFSEKKNALAEIWSYGHRNPQGIFFDKELQRLVLIEHGPRGGDEINIILPGRNYGWPVISYGKEYWGPVRVGEGTHKAGMEQPIKVYVPSIAPGSLLIYSGKAFPGWKQNLFSGALKARHLNRVVLDRQGKEVAEERLLSELDERIRALIESQEGWLYLSTDSGRILRVKPGRRP